MADQKDTVYIDIDDEITAIIDKVQGSSAKIVALVLPKRATALQSIVNMKLLKRTADDSGHHVVLITSESAILPLAGAVGIYAAKNLQSKPEVPDAPQSMASFDDEETVDIEEDLPKSSKKGLAEQDTIEMDDEATKPKTGASKSKDTKGLKIPNFEKFRVKLFLIIAGVIGFIIIWYLAVFAAPTAKITIITDSEDINASAQFTASTTATSVSVGDSIVPAEQAEDEKEETQKTTATGKKDLSAKASGTVTLSIDCADVDGSPPTIPSGTGVSAEGLTFITQSDASLTTPDFSDGCRFKGSSGVAAQNKGEQYNIAAASYSVSGYNKVDGSGTAMTGGSSKTATVVSQEDIDTAKAKMTISDDNVKLELQKQLEEQGYYAITDSFNKTNEKTVTSPKLGAEASEVSVTYSAKFNMLGVKTEDITEILQESIKDQIDPERQKIQEDGLAQASFTIKDRKSDGSAQVSISTIVGVGPNINTEELKQAIVGQKAGQAENTIRVLPGVKDVFVDPNPFWVNKVPSKTSKITIELKAE